MGIWTPCNTTFQPMTYRSKHHIDQVSHFLQNSQTLPLGGQTDRQTDRTNMRLDLFQQATYALCDTATPPSNNNNNKTEIYSISCCILCMIQLSRDSTVSRTLHTLHRSYQLILLLLQTGLVIYNKICKEELCGCVLWEVNPCVARRGRPCRRSKGVSFAYSPADATVTHYLLLQ